MSPFVARTEAREISPIHGDWVYGMKIDQSTGRRELAKRWYAMEMCINDRVKVSEDEQYPGIGIVELFDARGPNYSTLSLAEAIEVSQHPRNSRYKPMRFLISAANDSSLAVVTSRMGYDAPGNVHIPRPSRYSEYAGTERPIYMRDYPRAVDDELLTQRHIERMARRDIDPSVAIGQTAIDDTFRYMISGIKEIR